MPVKSQPLAIYTRVCLSECRRSSTQHCHTGSCSHDTKRWIAKILSFKGTAFSVSQHDEKNLEDPHCIKWKRPNTQKIACIWVHIYEILENANWICSDRKQITGCQELEVTGGIAIGDRRKLLELTSRICFMILMVILWVYTSVITCQIIYFKWVQSIAQKHTSIKIVLKNEKIYFSSLRHYLEN